jgi:putative ABC transport system substrate-binding protein
MTAFIGRREFITLLGGAAAWPLSARAQQGERMRRIGILQNLPEYDPVASALVAAFLKKLQQSGWNVGQNILVEPSLRTSVATRPS